jgi:predicted nucleic acid-binding protein
LKDWIFKSAIASAILVEVKMSESSKNSQSASNRCLSEKHHFGKFLGEVWKAVQDNQHWKYEQLSPVKLLERSKRHRYPPDNDELARANWFWSRRPRLHQVTSCTVWFIVALGLPLWLFMFPAIGVPLLIVSAVISYTEIVRSVRWRRQYELSIDRLIRSWKNGRDTFGMDIFA